MRFGKVFIGSYRTKAMDGGTIEGRPAVFIPDTSYFAARSQIFLWTYLERLFDYHSLVFVKDIDRELRMLKEKKKADYLGLPIIPEGTGIEALVDRVMTLDYTSPLQTSFLEELCAGPKYSPLRKKKPLSRTDMTIIQAAYEHSRGGIPVIAGTQDEGIVRQLETLAIGHREELAPITIFSPWRKITKENFESFGLSMLILGEVFKDLYRADKSQGPYVVAVHHNFPAGPDFATDVAIGAFPEKAVPSALKEHPDISLIPVYFYEIINGKNKVSRNHLLSFTQSRFFEYCPSLPLVLSPFSCLSPYPLYKVLEIRNLHQRSQKTLSFQEMLTRAGVTFQDWARIDFPQLREQNVHGAIRLQALLPERYLFPYQKNPIEAGYTRTHP